MGTVLFVYTAPHQPECCARIDSAARVREASCAGVYLRDSARSFSLHRPGRCSDQIIFFLLLLLRALPARRQGASADKLHVEAAKLYPLLDSPDPSKTQSTVGTVLSICTAPRQPGPIL